MPTSDIYVFIGGTPFTEGTYTFSTFSYDYDFDWPHEWRLSCDDGTTVGPHKGGLSYPVAVAGCSSCTLTHQDYDFAYTPGSVEWRGFGQSVLLTLGSPGDIRENAQSGVWHAQGTHDFTLQCDPAPPSPPTPPSPPPPGLPPSPPWLPGQTCATKYLYPGNHMSNSISEVRATLDAC